MKHILLSFVLIVGFTYGITAKQKDTIDVVLYMTSQDLLANKPMDIKASLITDEMAANYIFANKIIDKSTGKKVKESKFIWAIKYKGDYYVNMGYTDVMSTTGMYLKMDIVGTYCAIKFDDRMPYPNAKSAFYYGGSVLGYLVAKSQGYADDNQVWKVSEKKSVPIFYCNLEDKEYRNFQQNRNESCLLTYFSEKSLNNLIKKYPLVPTYSKPNADDILNYLNELNTQIKNKRI